MYEEKREEDIRWISEMKVDPICKIEPNISDLNSKEFVKQFIPPVFIDHDGIYPDAICFRVIVEFTINLKNSYPLVEIMIEREVNFFKNHITDINETKKIYSMRITDELITWLKEKQLPKSLWESEIVL